jgi:spore maturation protein CgeB
MLLADRTEEHCAFFEEGKEAEFFSSSEELIEKAKFYSGDEVARRRIAEAGLQRCVTSKYAYTHRLKAVLDELATL